MRFLFAVCLWVAGCAHMAHAAPKPTCYPGSSAASNFEIASQPSNLGFVFADPEAASFVVTWYCDEVYKWRGYGLVGWKRNLIPNWEAEINRLRAAARTDQDAAWDQYTKCSFLDGPCPEFDALKPLLDRQFAATKPDPIIWQVRDNPTSTSRPVFGLNADGTRNTTAVANQRVSDVSTNCGCTTTALEESGGVYCSVSGSPNVATADTTDVIPAGRVALCVRTN
jgi:hypothetical protein